jgi:hypothetical protein
MTTSHKSFKDRNFLLMIFYEGPWEKLCNFCWGIRKGKDEDDDSFRWVIGRNPRGWKKIMQVIANWAERRDMMWRAKYAIRRKDPPKRWKR